MTPAQCSQGESLSVAKYGQAFCISYDGRYKFLMFAKDAYAVFNKRVASAIYDTVSISHCGNPLLVWNKYREE